MKVIFCRGFLKHSFLIVAALVILAFAGTDVQAGFSNWSSAGPVGKVHSLAVATGGSPIYAGGNGAIYKSTDNANSWSISLAGPVIALGNGLIFKPGDTTTAYAAASDGVYKTTDSGTSWNLLSGSPAKGSGGLAVDPSFPNDLYVATVAGIFKSTDGGATWNDITTGITPADITAVAVYGSTLYAGTANSGVWSKPTSSGTWSNISNSAPLTTATISYLAVDPTGKVYALSGMSVYSTNDNGATAWSSSVPSAITGDSPVVLVIDPITSSTLYAGIIAGSGPGGIYKSVDGGSTWGLAATGIGTTGNCFSLALQPDNPAIVYAGQVNGIKKSPDGFSDYFQITSVNTGLHLASVKSFTEFIGTYYTGGGEGVWSSTDLAFWNFNPFTGPTFQQVSALASDSSISSVLAGVANLGSFQTYKYSNPSWFGATNKSGGGTGTDVVAMASASPNIYMAVAGDGVYWWDNTNTGWQFTGTAPGNTNITGLAAFGTNLFLSTKGGGIYLSNDAGSTWNSPAAPPASSNISAIRVMPGDITQLLAGSADGATSQLFMSTGLGDTWTAGATLPSDVTSIDINPDFMTNTAVIGTQNSGVFITSDGGLTVQPYTSGLPVYGSGFPRINSINFDPVSQNRLLIGLDGAGLYQRTMTPEITVTPAALDFGTLPVGSITTRPLQISNPGSLPLVISNISLSTTGPYTLDPGTCGSTTPTITAGQSCSIDVTFSPTIANSFGNGIDIISNAPVSFLSVSLSGAANGASADISWTGSAGDGKWGTANNWSLARLPLSTEKVAITLDGTYTVTVDTPATVAELIVGGSTGTQSLGLPASTLTVTTAAYFNTRSTISLNGGTLDGTGQVDIYGTLNWNGTIKGSGAFNLQAGATGTIDTTPNTYLEARTFNNYGVITYSGTTANSIQFRTNATFNNYGTFVTQSFGSLIDADSSGTTFNNMAGAIFRKTLDTSTTNVDMAFNNSGTINAKTGTISLNKTSSQSGICAIDSGTTLVMAGLGSHSINSGFSLVGAGTLSFTGGATIGLNVDLTNTVGAIAVNDATINGPGKLVNSAGKSLSLAKATINAALDNSGTIIANGSADSTINGTFTTFSGSTLTVDATSSHRTLTLATGFTNNGTIDLNSSANQWNAFLSVTSGILTNAAGANINALQGSGGTYYRYLNAALNNQGTVTASWPLYIEKASAAHSNSGTINANENITVTQSGTTPVPSFTNTGTIAIAATKAFTVSGGGFNNNTGSTFSGAGLLAFTNSIITLNDFFTVGVSSLKLTNTTVNGFYNLMNLTGKTLTLDGASVDVPLYNDGLTVAAGDTDSSINAGMVTSAGSTLRVDAITGHRTLTMGVGFTNYGTIELNSSANQWNATLAVTSGPLLNAAGGVINALQGSGGIYYRYLNAELNNQGTINASWPLYLEKTSAAHSNSGIINVNDNLTVTQSGTAPAPSFTNTGTIAIAANRTFTVSGGGFNNNTGSIFSGSGNLALTGAAAVTLNVDLTNTVGAISVNDATFNGPGKLVNAAGKSLTLAKATINSALDNSGSIMVNGSADSSIGGALTTQSGSTLTVDATTGHRTLTIANGFTNNGTINLNSSSGQWDTFLAVTSGTLVNASGAVINTLMGSGGIYKRFLNAQLSNLGVITASYTTVIDKPSASHSNGGTINVNDNVTFTQTGTTPNLANTGVINLAATKSLTVNGGSFNHSSGTLQGTGTLDVSGSIFTSSGDIHPNIGGSAGTLTITGALATTATESLNIDIGGTAAGTYDLLTVSDTASLNGTLNVNLVNSFVPTLGDSFTILNCGTSCSGTFATTNLPALTGAAWNINYGANAASLTVNPTITASADTFGSITPSGITSVNYGGNQGYTITPNTGYHISDVTVDGVSQGAITSYTFNNVTANHTINALFAPDAAATAFTLSGSVNYSGSKTGRIYVTVSTSNGPMGTSMTAPGSFSIQGVPAGVYPVTAFMDVPGTVSRHESDPSGASSPVTVATANVTGISITLTDPTPLTTVQPPTGLQVFPTDNAALAQWNQLDNGNGSQADSYSLYWDANPNPVPGSTTGSRLDIPATGDRNDLLLGGIANGTYYFVMTAKSGSVTSAPSTVYGPVTIGPPAGGYTVSGTVTFPAVANGKPLYLAIGDKNNTMYPAYIVAATSPQAYAVSGVPNGSYRVFGVIDVNNDGLLGIGDYKSNDLNAPVITVNNGALVNADLTIGSENAGVRVMTQHWKASTLDMYGINFELYDGLKRPVTARLNGGPNVTGPIDIGLNQWGGFYSMININTATPVINDSYTFDIGYSDGSSETISGTVTGVVNDFATPTTPTGSVSFNATPTLSWTAPANPPANGSYYLQLYEAGAAANPLFWDSNPLPLNQTSAVFNFDSSASQATLTNGKSYDWGVMVSDQQGNFSTSYASFSFPGEVSLTPAFYDFGTVPVGGGATWPLTISNNGSAPVSVYGITVSGADFTLDYTGGSNPCNSQYPFIAAGGNCTFNILINPATAGLKSATVTVTTNNVLTPSLTANFSATAANYTITAPVTAAGGYISPPGITSLAAGGNMIYYISPNTGYHIVDVKVDGVSQGAITSYTFSSVTANHTITATFAINSADISGTIGYSGSKTGRVYITLQPTGPTQLNNGILGTSIAAPGAFTIRGVPDGSYSVNAFMDSLDLGSQVQVSPNGATSATVAGANLTGLSITLSEPSPAAPAASVNVTASPGNGSLLMDWDKQRNNGIEPADAYDIYWGTSASVSKASNSGSRLNVPAGFDSPLVLDGLNNGDKLYVIVIAKSGGVESVPSAAIGPFTIGTPTGGYTVSGTLNYSGPPATGPLYIAIVNPMTKGAAGIYYTKIASPAASNSFTVTGVPNGNYVIYSIIDMNNDGLFGVGDVMTPDNQAPAITVNGAALTGVTASLTGINGEAAITTDHNIPASGPGEFFNLEGSVRGQLKRPVAITLTAAPPTIGIPLPMDLGLDGKDGSGNFRFWSGSSTRPTTGDSFTFTITYADGTVDTTATASVTGVSDFFPTATQISSPTTTVPVFSWSAPSPAPATAYSYSVWVGEVNNANVWDAWDLPASINSITYGATGDNPQPLLIGSNYYWHVSTKDQNGNRATIGNNFTPANQGTPIISWPAPAAITYGTSLSAAQLNATSSIPGTFTYTPVSGTVPVAGTQTLSVTFTPTDSVNYLAATASVNLTVAQATPVITWGTPAAITSLTPLSATQLNATASVPGTFSYSPASGSLLAAGTQTLAVTFTPADSVNYAVATASVNITVNLHTFPITASAATGGTITPPGVTSVLSGTTQDYVITANTGYHIVDVKIDGVSQGAIASYSFTSVTAGHTIDASFAVDTFTITASANSGGTITPVGATTLNYGASQSYTITPDAGYVLIDVKVDQVSVGKLGSYTFTNITAGHSIEAVFGADGVVDPANTTGVPQITDALIVLTAALGDATLTPAQLKKIDTAPIVNGVPQPDGKADMLDVLVMLRRVVGLEKW